MGTGAAEADADRGCADAENPAAGSQAMFKKEWLRFTDIRPATINVAILCDPASSRKKGSDQTAMLVVAIDAQRNRYLLDGYHHKMGLAERWLRLKTLRTKWMRQPGVQVVKVGYERYGMRDSIEYFEERMQIEGEYFEIVELAWPKEGPGSKYDRIQRLEPDFRNGRIYLIGDFTWIDEDTGKVIDQETANQRRVRETGEDFRIVKPVIAIDEERKPYRLNKGLIDEYLVYPFSHHDDMLDCLSRIYDIDLVPPMIVDQTLLEPRVFSDGI